MPGRPTIWMIVGQGPTALAVGARGGCLDIFTLIYPFFPLSPTLWETTRYRLKYCLRGPLKPKLTNQLLSEALSLLLKERICSVVAIILPFLVDHYLEEARKKDYRVASPENVSFSP